jgi:Gluconate 2-dehydrogenase subunit 3
MTFDSESEVAGPQTEAAVVQPTTAPRAQVLDEAQRDLLRAVLNQLVPARESLGGAGDLDVGESIESTLSASPRLRRLFLEGLAQVAITALQQTGQVFVSLDSAQQTPVLQAVEQALPLFFAALVEHTYRGYYVLTVVQQAVGFDARPPQPLGHTLPPFDPALLDRQRQRTPFWREAP